ncbi:MAG: hypothetical protein IJ656_01595 [Bacilli bacterium]|nr:hypothetical protein [Bacilli bacterium]
MKINKKLLAILLPVSMVSLIGLGFSTWAVAKQVSTNISVNLSVGNVETADNIDAFGSVTLQTFKMSQYGFEMSDGTYSQEGSIIDPYGGYITVNSSINLNLAKRGIKSLLLSNEMRIILKINGFDGNNTLNLNNIVTVNANKTNISALHNLTQINDGITVENGSEIIISYNTSVSDLTDENVNFSILAALSPVNFSTFYNTYKYVSNGVGFKVTLGAESVI